MHKAHIENARGNEPLEQGSQTEMFSRVTLLRNGPLFCVNNIKTSFLRYFLILKVVFRSCRRAACGPQNACLRPLLQNTALDEDVVENCCEYFDLPQRFLEGCVVDEGASGSHQLPLKKLQIDLPHLQDSRERRRRWQSLRVEECENDEELVKLFSCKTNDIHYSLAKRSSF